MEGQQLVALHYGTPNALGAGVSELCLWAVGVLERDAEDLGGSSIVCIDGLSKAPRTAAHPRDYRRVMRYGAEFQKRRRVLA